MEDCVSSSPKHAPELPQEIVEMIIGSVETDFPAALHSCSLVCRAWLHASQAKIFESISLASCSAKVRSFFDVLQSSPSLGKCVRELEVVSVRDVTPVWDVEDLNMLQVILTKLDCLRLLHVYGICPSKIWPHVSRSLQLFPMESVLELGLFAFDFLDTEFFISFFTNATPNVQSIIAKGIYVLTSPDMTFPRAPISGFMDCGSAPVLPQLLSLELNNLDAPEMYQILLSSFVQSLEVVLCSTHNIEVFCLLFRDSHAASSLVEITLTKFWGDTANIASVGHFTGLLSECANLRHINFTLGNTPEEMLQWAIPILLSATSQLTSLRLRHWGGCSLDIKRLSAVLDGMQILYLQLPPGGARSPRGHLRVSTLVELQYFFWDLHERGILKSDV